MSDGDPNRGARERQHERAEHVEQGMDDYPANSDELTAEYRSAEVALTNETETFADSDEARAALTTELRRNEPSDRKTQQ